MADVTLACGRCSSIDGCSCPNAWFVDDPQAGLEWAKQYLVGDIEEMANTLRDRGASAASFLEGKADLLRDMLAAALRPKPTAAIASLRQTLDAGIEVGVSRQALEEVLAWIG